MNEHPLREDIFRILRLLSSKDDFTQRALSNHMDISLGKTNYLLRSLAQKGLVKIRNFTSKDQKLKRVKYILTPEGLEEKLRLTYYFLRKKEEEYFALKQELEKTDSTMKKGSEV